MTILTFRTDAGEAEDAQAWADRLGVPLSELLREALRQHLVALRAGGGTATRTVNPTTEGDQSLGQIADWGPAEDWSEWADAAG